MNTMHPFVSKCSPLFICRSIFFKNPHRYSILITMERLKSDIKNKSFKQIYFLYGEETYLKKGYKKALTTAIIGDDTMNYSYFEGKDIDVSKIKEMAETLPFFAEKRLIVIENSGLCKSGGDDLADYIKTLPEYLYMIVIEADVDKRTRLYKTLSSKGVAVELAPLTGDQQEVWIAGQFQKLGKKITRQDIRYLISAAGDDMVNLQSEIEKLASLAGDRDVVTATDIDDIVTKQIGDNIFKMMEEMGNRNRNKALEYYNEMLQRREAPFKILALVAKQFNQLYQIKELLELRYPPKEIASKVKIHPYYIDKYINQSKKFDKASLRRALEACAKADEDIKLGKLKDELSVELLVIEFSK